MDMRYYRATEVGFWRALYLCRLAVFSPSMLEKENEEDAERLNQLVQGRNPEPAPYVIRRAFWLSLVAVLVSALVGYGIGVIGSKALGCISGIFIWVLQVAGACILLWGTLFVRGWQIQTYKGLTLAERVNQWIYRGMYCIGTVLVVCSIVISPCQ